MTKTRQWAMLAAVACLAVFAAGWLLVIKPQRSHASDLRAQTATVQGQTASLRTQVAQLQQQQKDLPSQQKLLSQIATKIPDNPALPALIRQLSAAADGAGVNLVSLAPGQPAVAAAQAPVSTTVTPTTTAAPAAAPLASIPLAVQVQGSYFNVEQFFAAVEGLNRAMLVTGFSMTPASGSSGGGAGPSGGADALPPGTLNASITAQVFEAPQFGAPTTTTGH